jgi:hypothetical protein
VHRAARSTCCVFHIQQNTTNVPGAHVMFQEEKLFPLLIYPRNRPWRPIVLYVKDSTLYRQSAQRWR